MKTMKTSRDPEYAAKKARVERFYTIADSKVVPEEGKPEVVSIHCMRDALEAVELGRPSTLAGRVLFRDLDVFALPARELVQRIREHTVIEADPDDAASFIAPDLLLSLWRPFEADDEPVEEQGYYFSSVLLAKPGYYDTPAQAVERLRQGS